MQATINGNTYHIEFSYRRKSHRYQPGNLAPSSPIEGLASCAIVKMPTSTHQSPLISVASVILSPDDRWSKRNGRWYAFLRAIESCGILRKEGLEFAHWFSQRFPDPARQSTARTTLTDEEKQALINAGQLKRQTRERSRAAGF